IGEIEGNLLSPPQLSDNAMNPTDPGVSAIVNLLKQESEVENVMKVGLAALFLAGTGTLLQPANTSPAPGLYIAGNRITSADAGMIKYLQNQYGPYSAGNFFQIRKDLINAMIASKTFVYSYPNRLDASTNLNFRIASLYAMRRMNGAGIPRIDFA